MIKEISKVTVQFKNLSEPYEVIELHSSTKFTTEEEAEAFSFKMLGILAPIHEKKEWEVNTFFNTIETDGTEKPMEYTLDDNLVIFKRGGSTEH